MAKHFDFAPLLMSARQAAHYLGVSESKLLSLNIKRIVHGGNKQYHRSDLDGYANDLPYEGESDGEENPCDQLFGTAS